MTNNQSLIYKAIYQGDFNVDVSRADLDQLDIEATGDETFNVILDNQVCNVKVIHADYSSKHFVLEINGKRHQLTLKDEVELLTESMGFNTRHQEQHNHFLAPMPGTVLELKVEAGQNVKEGDPLLILEAMKMENVLTTPGDGVIESVEVAPGDAVQKDQLLITFA